MICLANLHRNIENASEEEQNAHQQQDEQNTTTEVDEDTWDNYPQNNQKTSDLEDNSVDSPPILVQQVPSTNVTRSIRTKLTPTWKTMYVVINLDYYIDYYTTRAKDFKNIDESLRHSRGVSTTRSSLRCIRLPIWMLGW